ncbi:MAG: transporter substrate-binding domain-containing protein [Desulfobacterales bacterium]
MRGFLTISILAAILACFVSAAETRESRQFSARGDNNYPPYEFNDRDGNPSGFTVEILRAAAAETGMDVSISLGPWNEVRTELENREIDIITGMYYSGQRDKLVDFSVPHTMVSHSVFVRNSDKGTDPEDDLSDKALIVQSGDIMHDYVIEHGLGRSVHQVENPEEALFLLESGIHDCALLPLRQGLYFIEKHGHENITALDPPILQSKYCFAVKQGEDGLLARLNEGLFALKTKGEYRDIYNKWFGVYEKKDTWETLKYYVFALGAALLLLCGSLLWSRSLKKQVSARTRELEEQTAKHRETAEALKITESRFQLAVQAAGVGLWNWDDIQKDRVWWSPQIYEMLGHDPEETSPSFSFYVGCIHPEDSQRVKNAIADHLKYQTPYDIEHRLRTRSGKYRWFRAMGQAQWDENGTAVRMAGSIQDITELKRSEAERVRLATAVEQTEEGIVITDHAGRTDYVNASFVRMTGCEISELIGASIAELWEKQNHDEGNDPVRDAISSGRPWKGRLITKTRSDRQLIAAASISPLRDKTGRITSFVQVCREITREVELENRLRQSEKMEAIGTLAGGVAHDFNNILYAAIGHTELAADEAGPGTSIDKHLQKALKSAWRARDLVRQLLLFSRYSGNYLQQVSLSQVAGHALESLRPTLGPEIMLKKDFKAKTPVRGDPDRLGQAVTHLYNNAVQAMQDQGGTLFAETADVEMDEQTAAGRPDLQMGKYVRFTVTDSGSGIAEEIRERIFEPFFTTRTLGNGNGLGLAVVHGIVKSHGGVIFINPAQGGGTRVDVFFPAETGPTKDTE